MKGLGTVLRSPSPCRSRAGAFGEATSPSSPLHVEVQELRQSYGRLKSDKSHPQPDRKCDASPSSDHGVAAPRRREYVAPALPPPLPNQPNPSSGAPVAQDRCLCSEWRSEVNALRAELEDQKAQTRHCSTLVARVRNELEMSEGRATSAAKSEEQASASARTAAAHEGLWAARAKALETELRAALQTSRQEATAAAAARHAENDLQNVVSRLESRVTDVQSTLRVCEKSACEGRRKLNDDSSEHVMAELSVVAKELHEQRRCTEQTAASVSYYRRQAESFATKASSAETLMARVIAREQHAESELAGLGAKLRAAFQEQEQEAVMARSARDAEFVAEAVAKRRERTLQAELARRLPASAAVPSQGNAFDSTGDRQNQFQLRDRSSDRFLRRQGLPQPSVSSPRCVESFADWVPPPWPPATPAVWGSEDDFVGVFEPRTSAPLPAPTCRVPP